jgi:hypothetical protein
VGNLGLLGLFNPPDVGFNFFGHGHQDGRRASVEDSFGEATTLLGSSAHSIDGRAIFFGHQCKIHID